MKLVSAKLIGTAENYFPRRVGWPAGQTGNKAKLILLLKLAGPGLSLAIKDNIKDIKKSSIKATLK